MSIRFSDFFEEILEFQVESLDKSTSSKQSVTTLNIKMLDGFEANKTFYTDLNGLEMTKRIQSNSTPAYYPVTSSLSIRDTSSFRQVTVMPDRPSLATADFEKSTISFA